MDAHCKALKKSSCYSIYSHCGGDDTNGSSNLLEVESDLLHMDASRLRAEIAQVRMPLVSII